MNPSSKILWGEGLFLRPQHFQRQDAYHEARLVDAMRALTPYPWGLRRLRVDADALVAGMLRLRELQLVLPDGEFFNAPRDDELPEPLALRSIPVGIAEIVFHAALAPWRASGSNCSSAAEAADAGLRYSRHELESADAFTAAAPARLTVLRRSLRLLPEGAPRDHLVHVPLLRLRRTGAGAFALDERFMPPVLAISAAPALEDMLRRLLDTLQAKVDALYGLHREPSRHVVEFRSGDVASFWLLHTASAAYAALSHLHHHPGLHPERLYERMLELAGALMTYSRSKTIADLPPYDHAAPQPCFAALEAIVRELLETVISTRCLSIMLEETKPSSHNGRLDSQKIGKGTTLILGVQARMAANELVTTVPRQFKAGSPDDVDNAVEMATHAVGLTHLPSAPDAVPVRAGVQYFALESGGRYEAAYQQMLKAQAISVYAPAGLPELKLELFAVNT